MPSDLNQTVKFFCRGPDFQCQAVKNPRTGEKIIQVSARIDSISPVQLGKFAGVCARFRQIPCRQLPSLLSLRIDAAPQNSAEKKICLAFQAPEDISLETYLTQTHLEPVQAFRIIVQIAETLDIVHKTGIFIGTLNPCDIYIDPRDRTVFLTNFGPFSMGCHPVPACDMGCGETFNPALFDRKVLPYISPELTGLVGRRPDFRSDFYTIGILLYEMLAFRPPFTGATPRAIIHGHIAKSPPVFSSLGLNIPDVISDIVQRLLKKRPDDRYQSLQGIVHDLKACLDYLEKQGPIPSLPLGQNDVCSQFKIPDTVYGRQKEIGFLNNQFDKLSKGFSSFIFIKGYSGIGKTTLVREFESSLQTCRPRNAKVQFISGKFDIHKEQKPFGALIDALRDLILNMLTLDEKAIWAWQAEIIKDSGINVGLICEMIPEARILFGPQPPARPLGPRESQNRFQLTVISFLRANCRADHPLILFLDDLQWVDNGSVNLMGRIYDLDIPHLFFIGAFRENEVDRSHPLSTLISHLGQKDDRFNLLSLQALPFRDVSDLVKDTVNQEQEAVFSLAELLNKKTGGNPYYLKEYLHALHADNLLVFDPGDGKWHWRNLALVGTQVTENVADLSSIRLGKMKTRLQRVLNFAACLGARFDLLTLSMVLDKSPEETAVAVGELVEKNILIPAPHPLTRDQSGQGPGQASGNHYRFAHDRLHHAAYRLISGPEREKRHLTIARRWYEKITPDELDRHIFEITTHFNYGKTRVKDKAQRRVLVELNHLAARKSKIETAFENQFHYLKICLGLLEKECWTTEYELALSIYSDAVEAAYLCGSYHDMDHLLQIVLHHAESAMDTTAVRNTQILGLKARDRLEEAIQSGLDTLKKMGVRFPENPAGYHVLASLVKTLVVTARNPGSHFMNVNVLDDQRIMAIQKTLSILSSSAYFVSPRLGLLIAFKQLHINRLYGLTKDTPATLAGYSGVVLCGIMENPGKGYRFGLTALELMEKLDVYEQKAKVLTLVYAFINHWKDHIRNGLKPLEQAHQAGIEAGDFEFAAISKYVKSYHALFAGENLVKLEKELAGNHEKIKDFNQITTLKYIDIYWQCVLNLMGRSGHPTFLEGSVYRETDRKKESSERGDQNSAAIYYHTKMILACLFYENYLAVDYLEKSESVFQSAVATLGVPLLHFYGALACLRASDQANPPANLPSKTKLTRKAGRFIKKLKKWALHAPMNHEHKYLLVKAEQARISMDDKKAAMLYDRAIALAEKHRFINEEALAWELAGGFYHARNLEVPARVYLTQAVNRYGQWGAFAKVSHLKSLYPFLNHSDASSDMAARPFKKYAPIDASAVIKASETIFGETVIQRLMEKLMDMVFKAAGAQKAGLVLDNGHGWILSALVPQNDLPPFSHVPLSQCREVPVRVIESVFKTGKNLMFGQEKNKKPFADDSYLLEHNPLSVLAVPVRHQGVTSGVLYLENKACAGAFTLTSVNVLETVAKILANAWAINQAQEEILSYQDRLRALSSELLITEEKERRKLAVALHDQIGHALSHAVMVLEKLEQKQGPKSTGGLDRLAGILDRAIEETRFLTFALSPPVLYDLGLSAALDWLAEQTYKTHKINVSFFDEGEPGNGQAHSLDENLRILMFQCVRELLSNVVRHARTNQAALSMGKNQTDLWVTVSDQGIGFDPDKINPVGKHQKGLGLFSIQERLGSQGGYMDVDAAPGAGARITVVLPCKGPETQQDFVQEHMTSSTSRD